MVQIAGKYELVNSKNFYEFLIGIGVPEEHAKVGKDFKESIEVKVDGNKIVIASSGPVGTTNITVGEEFDETTPDGKVLKSTAKLSTNVLTVTSKTAEGEPAGSRTYTFIDSGLNVDLNIPKDGKTHSASRIFKRV